LTIRAAQANYETFAYADTDSLHLLQPEAPDTLEVHPSKLGAWKFEYAFDNAFYIRSKAYLEHLPNTEPFCEDETCDDRHDYVTRIAGLPATVASKLSFEDLKPGLILHGKLNPKTVPGGVVLKDVPFELKIS
jgi:hypothetical protein